jgi:hypothetical protein
MTTLAESKARDVTRSTARVTEQVRRARTLEVWRAVTAS